MRTVGYPLSRDGMSTTQEQFFTPAELCERWKIDPRTLDTIAAEFSLRWVWLTPKIRRLSKSVVERIELEQGLGPRRR